MDLSLIKKKLIEKIQSSNDEILIVEMLDMVEQQVYEVRLKSIYGDFNSSKTLILQ